MTPPGEPARAPAWLRTLSFTLLFPGTVCVVVPLVLDAAFAGAWPLPLGHARHAGSLLLGCGIAGYLACAARFVREGRGTPAPWDAPSALVGGGLYRWVRNPMYVSILACVTGTAIARASGVLLLYAVLAWLAFHLRVLAYEEPTLRRRFGARFDDYCARVPRWLPRLPRAPRPGA